MPIGPPNLGSDITNSLIGRVGESAQLIINDKRKLRDTDPTNAEGAAEYQSELAKANAKGMLGQASKEIPITAPGIPMPPGTIPTAPAMPDFDISNRMQEEFVKNYSGRKLIFEVQFNPSELSLNASALTINKQSLGVNKGSGASKSNTSASSATINLNVNLIFDKMNETDAFQVESGTLGAAGIATSVATASALAMGKVFSVKPEVEALMAALRDEYTRDVEFRWNDFSFAGTLQFVQVRYTMFSPAGHPVRATVAIRMKREATMNDQWEQDFEEAFTGAGGQTLSRTQQNRFLNM